MTCRWTIEDTINGLEGMILSTKFIEHDFNGIVNIEACEQAIDLLKAQEQDSKKIIEKGKENDSRIVGLHNEANKKVHFILDGCDISFGAEAPADMTLAELLKQCDRIQPDWCACGIRSYDPEHDYSQVELSFDYDDVRKVYDPVSCRIMPKEEEHATD
jgi:hypothetical protein